MSFSRSSNEIQVSDASKAAVVTLSVADAGLDAFFSDTFTVRPQPGDSFRYNVVDGYAWVVPEELQRPADTVFGDVVYSVRSTGYLIEPAQGSTPIGVRTIVQFARWQIGSIQTQAMYTSAHGIGRRTDGLYALRGWGGSGLCAHDTDIARTRTRFFPTGTVDIQTGWGPIWGSAVSDSAVAAQTGIQWASIVGGSFEPDYYTVQYGDTVGFSSQLHVGNLILTAGDRGSGLLIVTGDLTTSGGGAVEWRGIVLVGGRIETNAASTDFHGIVATGLNSTLGAYAAPDSVAGTGINVNFQYELCFVDSTVANLTGMVPIARSHVDNWATY